MTTITLQRSGDAPLRFKGREITKINGGDVEWSGTNRWYELAVYQAENGLYVGCCVFRSQWRGEADYSQCGAAKTPGGIVDWFRDLNPNPDRLGFPPTPEYAARQERLLAALRDQYDTLLAKLLDHEVFVDSDLGSILYDEDEGEGQ